MSAAQRGVHSDTLASSALLTATAAAAGVALPSVNAHASGSTSAASRLNSQNPAGPSGSHMGHQRVTSASSSTSFIHAAPLMTSMPSAPAVPTLARDSTLLSDGLPPDKIQLVLYTYKPSIGPSVSAGQPLPLSSSPSDIPTSHVQLSYESLRAKGWDVQPGDYLEIRRARRTAFGGGGGNGGLRGDGGGMSKGLGGTETSKAGGEALRGVPKGKGRDGYVFRVGEDCSNVPVGQIQVPESVATAFRFQHRLDVEIHRVEEPYMANADFVELRFSQYLGRADMWRLGMSLEGQTIHVGEKVALAGGAVRAEVHALWRGKVRYSSGTVTSKTKTIYRSRSAQVYVFIQLCAETWEFDEDGERYYEKVVHGFLPDLFERWNKRSASHLVTIILFARMHYNAEEIAWMEKHNLTLGLTKDYAGRWCKDFFRIVIDFERRTDWSQALPEIKRRLERSEREILLDFHLGLQHAQGKDKGEMKRIIGKWSFAYEGNVLEAVNLALNPFDEHYIDRDLSRTGLNMTIITPGTGHFAVDKRLLRLTSERMVDHGIGLDLVCLTKMPLHSVPLFSYISKKPKSGYKAVDGDGVVGTPDLLYFDADWLKASDVELADCYSIPKWVNASFYSKAHDKPFRTDRFIPRCKMYQIQMLGILDHNLTTVTVPHLAVNDTSRAGRQLSPTDRQSAREEFDANTFGSIRDIDENMPRGGRDELKSTPTGSSVGASYQSARLLARRSKEQDRDATPMIKPAKSPSRTAEPLDLHKAAIPHTSPHLSSSLSIQREEKLASMRSLGKRRDSTQTAAQTPVPTIKRERSSSNGTERGFNPRVSPITRARSPTGVSVMSSQEEVIADSQSGASTPKVTPARTLNRKASKASFGAKLGASWLFAALTSRSQPSFPTAKVEPVARTDVAFHSTGTRPGTPVTTSKSASKPLAVPGAVEIVPATPSPAKDKFTTQPLPIVAPPGSTRAPSDDGMARSLRNNSAKTGKSPRSLTDNSWVRAANYGQASRQVTVNPCFPKENVDMWMGEGRRWQHVRPKKASDTQHLVQWTSLCAPACLPLTTDYLPTQEEIRAFYEENSYEIVCVNDGDSFLVRSEQTNFALAVMKEMASQRLSQNFQFIVSPHDSPIAPGDAFPSKAARVGKVLSANENISDALRVGGASEALRSPNGVIYLILSHIIHRLSCDDHKQSVTVQRFVRKTRYGQDPIQYTCLIWPSAQQEFRLAGATFKYPNSVSFSLILSMSLWADVPKATQGHLGFNFLDRLIAGDEGAFDPSLRYWRTRYLLIPTGKDPSPGVVPKSENFNPSEIMFTGAYKVLELLGKHQWTSPGAHRTHLNLLPTTFDPSACVLDDGLMTELERVTNGEEAVETGLKLEGMTLQALADMMCKEKNGLVIRERWWHFSVYEDCFTGLQFAEWLVKTFDDVDTIDAATEWGKSLFDKELFEHVLRKHGFFPYIHLYYRLRPGYDRNSKKRRIMGWFSGEAARDPREVLERHAALSTSPSASAAIPGPGPGPGTGAAAPVASLKEKDAQPGRKKRKITMSQTCVVDLDPSKKSDRSEVAILHADVIHNARNAFHFELNWVGVTAGLLDELRTKCSAQAERYGLRFVEAPVEQIKDISLKCAYRSPIQIRLALAPPVVPDLHLRLGGRYGTGNAANFFEYAILTHRFGFVLDVEAASRYPETIDVEYKYRRQTTRYEYSQFCHRSGLALVQCVGGEEGYLWADNRLFIAAPTKGGGARGAPGERDVYPNAPVARWGKQEEARALREELEAFCADKEALRKFYEEIMPEEVGANAAAAAAGAASEGAGAAEAAPSQETKEVKVQGEADGTAEPARVDSVVDEKTARQQ